MSLTSGSVVFTVGRADAWGMLWSWVFATELDTLIPGWNEGVSPHGPVEVTRRPLLKLLLSVFIILSIGKSRRVK
jgi:hypothetical protein